MESLPVVSTSPRNWTNTTTGTEVQVCYPFKTLVSLMWSRGH